MCWQGASSTTTGRRQGSRAVRRGGGALPTRGVSSYRRLQKPEAWALRAYASFFVFTAVAALWERPAPHGPRFPWRESVLLDSGDIEGSRVGSALWENHPRRTAPLPLAKKRFVEFGGYRKAVPLHRPRSGSAPPRTNHASLGERTFCWVRGVSKGRELGACSGRSPRCMTLLNGSGRKLMAHA